MPFQKGHKINTGRKWTEESKQRLSNFRLGRRLLKPMSKKGRENISKSHIGHNVSEETKKRISLSNKGKKMTDEAKRKISNSRKGILPWNKGKKMSQEQLIKMSGKNSHNWKGGVTPIYEKIRKSAEYGIWRTQVFVRDNYICVWCGQKGGKLNADHIKPFADYPELRLVIDNGRTLCESCHRKTDTWGFNLMWKKKNLYKELKEIYGLN